jgi:hypothetical protein
MQFLRRNQYFLLTLGVLIASSVLVVRQFLANQSAHAQRVEDFLLLHERAEAKLCEHSYQRLVQELPGLNDRSLVQDLQRTAMVVDVKTPQLDNLVWKYHVGVGNELKRRAEKRLEAALSRLGRDAETP